MSLLFVSILWFTVVEAGNLNCILGLVQNVHSNPKCQFNLLTLEGVQDEESRLECKQVKPNVFQIVGDYKVFALNCSAPYHLDLDYDGFNPTEAIQMYRWREGEVTLGHNNTNYTIESTIYGLDVTITSIETLYKKYRGLLESTQNQFLHQNLSTPISYSRSGQFTVRGMRPPNSEFKTTFYFFFQESILNDRHSFLQNKDTRHIQLINESNILIPCRPSHFTRNVRVMASGSMWSKGSHDLSPNGVFDPTKGFQISHQNLANLLEIDFQQLSKVLRNLKFTCTFNTSQGHEGSWLGSLEGERKNGTIYGFENFTENSGDRVAIKVKLLKNESLVVIQCDVTSDSQVDESQEILLSFGTEIKTFSELKFRVPFSSPVFANKSYFVQMGRWDEKNDQLIIDKDKTIGITFCMRGSGHSLTFYAGSPWTNTFLYVPPNIQFFDKPFHVFSPAQHIRLELIGQSSSAIIYDRTLLTFRCSIREAHIMYKPIFWFTKKKDGTLNLVFEDQAKVTVNTFSTFSTFLSTEIVEIFCLGPLWQSDYWRKASMSLNVTVGTNPVIVKRDGGFKFPIHSQNKRIHCEAMGDPTPLVWLTKMGKVIGEKGKETTNYDIGSLSTDSIGEYFCTAQNIYGEDEVKFRVDIDLSTQEQTETALAVGLTLSILLILIITILFLYFRYRSRRQMFTLDEMRDFEQGVNDDDPTNEYSYALAQPYKPEFEIPTNEFTVDETQELGAGAFGRVCKGSVRSRLVAVKTIKRGADKALIQALLSELKIFIYLGTHPNVIELIGANTINLRRGIVYIFLEMCELGSLLGYLKQNRRQFQLKSSSEFGLRVLHQWAFEIAQGMAYLSLKKVIHGDLAARNVLLTSDRTAKITDFGLSRQLYERSMYMKKNREPLPWRSMALESLMDMKFTCMSDVWGYGVTLWEVYSLGQVPFPGLNWDLNFVEGLKNGVRLNCPSMISQELYSRLLAPCWENEAEDRPTFSTLIEILQQILG